MQGKRVVHVKHGTLGEMHIYYDGNRPDMVLYNGATYRYVHSLQGDILGLQNGTGAFVVEYRYDAWGRQISKTGSLANSLGTLNPFRYRGYVYDEETSLYYLRTRYYNPNWCRFISSDSIVCGNLFAYCWGSPISFRDNDGYMPVAALNLLRGLYNNDVITSEGVSAITLAVNAGNIGTGFHEIAQLNIAKELYKQDFIAILEYPIPQTHSEADIFANGFIWEVKPFGKSGRKQLYGYLSSTGALPGFDMNPIGDIPILGKDLQMIITIKGGVAHYSFYRNGNRVKSTEVAREVSEKAFWAACAVAAIIVGGIGVENMITAGTGVWNDIPVLIAAGRVGGAILGY